MKRLFSLFLLLACMLLPPRPENADAQYQESPPGFNGEKTIVAPNSTLAEPKQGLWLVEARCLSVTPDFKHIAQWKIEHVFSGPTSLKAREFDVRHQLSAFSGALPFAPDVNEKALWCVQILNGVVWVPSQSIGTETIERYPYGISLPIGQHHFTFKRASSRDFSSYGDALVYSQSVERIATAEPDEQIRLLQRYAKSSSPQ